MKKILGISLVALFAVSPMMAKADKLAAVTIATPEGNEIGDANKVAAVSYVKGAYTTIAASVNSAYDEIDKKQVQLKNGANNINSAVSSTVRAIADENGADDTTLVTEKAVRNAINAADSAMDARVTANTNAIATLNGNSTTEGSLEYTLEAAKSFARDGGNLNSGSVATAAIASYAVTTDKINSKAVTSAQIADNTITAGQIADSTITATQLASSAVTSAKIAADAVTSAAIATGAVGTAELAENAVTSAAIATGAVTSTEILDGTITVADINAEAMKGTTTANYSGLTQLTTQGYVDEKVATANSDKATKTGVENTIKNASYNLTNSAVTGNVIAMASWGDSATTTIALQSGQVTSTAVSAVSSTVNYPAN